MLMSRQAKKPLLNIPKNTNNIKIKSIIKPPKKGGGEKHHRPTNTIICL